MFKDDEPADTTPYGAVTYTVNFGDGVESVPSHSTVLYHTYNRTGRYKVSVMANNSVSQVSRSGTIVIVQGEEWGMCVRGRSEVRSGGCV